MYELFINFATKKLCSIWKLNLLKYFIKSQKFHQRQDYYVSLLISVWHDAFSVQSLMLMRKQ